MFEVRAEYPVGMGGMTFQLGVERAAGYCPVVVDVSVCRGVVILLWRFRHFATAVRVRWRLECRYPLDRVGLREL